MSEVQNTTKEWKNVSQHNSYESADKKRKSLLEQNKDNEDWIKNEIYKLLESNRHVNNNCLYAKSSKEIWYYSIWFICK